MEINLPEFDSQIMVSNPELTVSLNRAICRDERIERSSSFVFGREVHLSSIS